MGRYILVVPSAAHAGSEDDYNRWYDEIHLADLRAIPGIVSGKRFNVSSASPAAPPAPFLAIYEIETDDPLAVLAELNHRAGSGQMKISPALDVESAHMWLYEAR